MGAAWREVKDGKDFDQVLELVPVHLAHQFQVLELVREVHGLGMEVCCTLGMLTESQAQRLKEAGCYAYNHNLDTSPEFYGKIISTRTYADRLRTLGHVRKAGMTVCCGGIIGMGENRRVRAGLIAQLANLDPQPESVPINNLTQVEGTPLHGTTKLDPLEFVRTIAATRIAMPKAWVRLSAGRESMPEAVQALCFLAGANSVFYGEKLLTTGNPQTRSDRDLFSKLGLRTV
jgi:biotin synthase